MQTPTPHFAVEQARDAAHGGDGWESRLGTTADELGSIWAELFRVNNVAVRKVEAVGLDKPNRSFCR